MAAKYRRRPLSQRADRSLPPAPEAPAIPEAKGQEAPKPPAAGVRRFRTVTNQSFGAVRTGDPKKVDLYHPRNRGYKTSYF